MSALVLRFESDEPALELGADTLLVPEGEEARPPGVFAGLVEGPPVEEAALVVEAGADVTLRFVLLPVVGTVPGAKGPEGTFGAASASETPVSWPHGATPIVPKANDGDNARSAVAKNAGIVLKSAFNQVASVSTTSLVPSAYWIVIEAARPAGPASALAVTAMFEAKTVNVFVGALRSTVNCCARLKSGITGTPGDTPM